MCDCSRAYVSAVPGISQQLNPINYATSLISHSNLDLNGVTMRNNIGSTLLNSLQYNAPLSAGIVASSPIRNYITTGVSLNNSNIITGTESGVTILTAPIGSSRLFVVQSNPYVNTCPPEQT